MGFEMTWEESWMAQGTATARIWGNLPLYGNRMTGKEALGSTLD